MQARCGAHCRTTGNPCLNFPMPHGRCRMHGGKSSGRPVLSGYYTNDAIKRRRELNDLICEIRQMTKQIEQG
jgi:hypothetical protein